MKKKVINIIKILRTFIRKSFKKSDLKRWEPLSSFNKSWDGRTSEMSKFILPNSKILEFGAGRMILKDYLPENCTYIPSDIVDRGYGTIVCDLNKTPLPVFDRCDYCVFSGVLEYVNNVPKLIEHLSEYVGCFIISYAVVKKGEIMKRGIHGWVNNYTHNNIIKIFEERAYSLTHNSNWLNQGIFVFCKKSYTKL